MITQDGCSAGLGSCPSPGWVWLSVTHTHTKLLWKGLGVLKSNVAMKWSHHIKQGCVTHKPIFPSFS